MTGGEVAVVIVAVALGATIKSVTGMGLPIVAIPIISLFVGPETAVAVIALPNLAQNVALVTTHRDYRGGTVGLGRLTVFGVAGAALGASALGRVPETVVLSVLFVALCGYLVTTIRRPDVALDPATARRWSPAVGFVAGVFQGGIGISGPIVGTWHHGLRLTQGAFVFSVSWLFLVSGGTQVLVFLTNGQLEGRLGVSALITVLVLATVPVGRWLRSRLSGPAFERAVLGLLAVSTVSIGIDIARGIAG